MNIHDLLFVLKDEGVTVSVTPLDKLKVTGPDEAVKRWVSTIKEAKQQIIDTYKRAPKLTPSPNRYLNDTEWHSLHFPAWDEPEVQAFQQRHTRMIKLGLTDGLADIHAERMAYRDRMNDDRRLCFECQFMTREGCSQRGPVSDVFQRCTLFIESDA